MKTLTLAMLILAQLFLMSCRSMTQLDKDLMALETRVMEMPEPTSFMTPFDNLWQFSLDNHDRIKRSLVIFYDEYDSDTNVDQALNAMAWFSHMAEDTLNLNYSYLVQAQDFYAENFTSNERVKKVHTHSHFVLAAYSVMVSVFNEILSEKVVEGEATNEEIILIDNSLREAIAKQKSMKELELARLEVLNIQETVLAPQSRSILSKGERDISRSTSVNGIECMDESQLDEFLELTNLISDEKKRNERIRDYALESVHQFCIPQIEKIFGSLTHFHTRRGNDIEAEYDDDDILRELLIEFNKVNLEKYTLEHLRKLKGIYKTGSEIDRKRFNNLALSFYQLNNQTITPSEIDELYSLLENFLTRRRNDREADYDNDEIINQIISDYYSIHQDEILHYDFKTLISTQEINREQKNRMIKDYLTRNIEIFTQEEIQELLGFLENFLTSGGWDRDADYDDDEISSYILELYVDYHTN